MKKVGIMSMQRIFNYGSFLQAYGLKKMLESIDNDIKVTFVDYRPGEVLLKKDSKSKGIIRIIKKLKEYNSIDNTLRNKMKFFYHKKRYSKRYFPLLGISKDKNYDTNLDLLIIGSDEVFNCVQSNTNVGYSLDLFGKNSKSKTLISYAGSFGNTTIDKINKYNLKQEIFENFSRFDHISVRDNNSKKIIESLGIGTPKVHVDPVLAYDFMEKEPLIPKETIYKSPYLIVYGYSGRLNKLENNIIKEFARKKNLKILCFGGVQDCCDEFIDCTPFELLAYFRDSSFIITDTFHGTIFSLINKKKFITLIRKSTGLNYGNEEKLTFLLNTFNLIGRGIYDLSEISLEKSFLETINYDQVFEILEQKRNDTYGYLKAVLK